MKKILLILLLCGTIPLLTTPLFTNEPLQKKRLAVLHLKGIDVKKTLTENIEENLITYLIQEGSYQIIERSHLDQIMNELQLSNSDDFSDDNAIKLGNLSGAELVLVGSVTQYGKSLILNIRIVDVKTGSAILAENKEIKENQLLSGIKQMAGLIASSSNNTTINNDAVKKETKQTKKEWPRIKKDVLPDQFGLTGIQKLGIMMNVTGATLTLGGMGLLFYDLFGYKQTFEGQIFKDEPYEQYITAIYVDQILLISGISTASIGLAMLATSFPLMLVEKIYKNYYIPFNPYIMTGIIFSITGASAFIPGCILLFYDLFGYKLLQEYGEGLEVTDYEEYTTIKETDLALFIAGVSTIGLGVALIGSAIPFFIKGDLQEKQSVTFFVTPGYTSSIGVSIKL